MVDARRFTTLREEVVVDAFHLSTLREGVVDARGFSTLRSSPLLPQLWAVGLCCFIGKEEMNIMPDLAISDMSIEAVNRFLADSLVGHLGMEILELGQGRVRGRMPVDRRTRQPQGALHGGASLAFAETLGGVGAAYFLDLERQFPVGVEINANHIRAVTSGYVVGVATALHIGKRTHVWEIKLFDDQERLTCASRFTQAIIDIGVG
uniref:Uncharacterized domain 1-containing protein n=1 Tax=Candidatus Kentrum sp. DK TaxID=2126562 RepID=A0A450S237_9GAMM|nr:MAG: uncharacterized domain 1-containing protein [Candidatus Kentron sp. DK]